MTGISLGVVAAAGAGTACHPSSQKRVGEPVRSANQLPSSVPSTASNLRQSRIKATSTETAGSDGSGRLKAKRAEATSQITWPLGLERHSPRVVQREQESGRSRVKRRH